MENNNNTEKLKKESKHENGNSINIREVGEATRKASDILLTLIKKMMNEEPLQKLDSNNNRIYVKGVILTRNSLSIYNSNKIGKEYTAEDESNSLISTLIALGGEHIDIEAIQDILSKIKLIDIKQTLDGTRYYSVISLSSHNPGKGSDARYKTKSTTLIFIHHRYYIDETNLSRSDERLDAFKYAKYMVRSDKDILIYLMHEQNTNIGAIRKHKEESAEGRFYIGVKSKDTSVKFKYVASKRYISESRKAAINECPEELGADGNYRPAVNPDISFSLLGYRYIEKKIGEGSSLVIEAPNIVPANVSQELVTNCSAPGIVLIPKNTLYSILCSSAFAKIEFKSMYITSGIQMYTTNYNIITDRFEGSQMPENEYLRVYKTGYDIVFDEDRLFSSKQLVELSKTKTIILEYDNLDDIAEIEKLFAFTTDSERERFINSISYIAYEVKDIEDRTNNQIPIENSKIPKVIPQVIYGYKMYGGFKELLIMKNYLIFKNHFIPRNSLENILNLNNTGNVSFVKYECRPQRSTLTVRVGDSLRTTSLDEKKNVTSFMLIKYLIEHKNLSINFLNQQYMIRNISIEDKPYKVILKITPEEVYFSINIMEDINEERLNKILLKSGLSLAMLLSPAKLVNLYGETGTGKSDMLVHLISSVTSKDSNIVVIDTDRDICESLPRLKDMQNILYIRNKIDITEVKGYNPRFIFINNPITETEMKELLLHSHYTTTIVFVTPLKYIEYLKLIDTDDTKIIKLLIDSKYNISEVEFPRLSKNEIDSESRVVHGLKSIKGLQGIQDTIDISELKTKVQRQSQPTAPQDINTDMNTDMNTGMNTGTLNELMKKSEEITNKMKEKNNTTHAE